MGVFDKNIVCEYCKKEMTASYRSKRFCSDKCRVYFRRENVQFIKQKTGQIDVQKSVQNNALSNTKNKELNSWEKLRNKKLGIK